MNIKEIIINYKRQMISAGLLREAGGVKLSPHVAALRPSLTKINRAVIENPELLRNLAQPSPFQVLFEYTLPKIEPLLVELGEEKAGRIIRRLCEHGKQIMADYPERPARQHLEELFSDLPGYEKQVRESGGVETLISAYKRMQLEGDSIGYLKLNITAEKINLSFEPLIIGNLVISLKDDAREIELLMVDLSFRQRIPIAEGDLACLKRVSALQTLRIHESPVKDEWLSYLAGAVNLRELYLPGTGLIGTGLKSLTGLACLKHLGLDFNHINDHALEALAGTGLQRLELSHNPIGNAGLGHISKIPDLRVLDLSHTRITAEGLPLLYPLEELSELDLRGTLLAQRNTANTKALTGLREAIPGLEIHR